MKKQKIISVILIVIGIITAGIAMFKLDPIVNDYLYIALSVIASVLITIGLTLYNLERGGGITIIKITKKTKRKILTVLSLALIATGIIGIGAITVNMNNNQTAVRIYGGMSSIFLLGAGIIFLINRDRLIK